MSFQTNNDDDQDQDQATTTLPHDGTTMFQFATTTTDHGSMLMEHVQHQPFENRHHEFPNQSSNSEGAANGFSFDSGRGGASSAGGFSFGGGSASSAGGFSKQGAKTKTSRVKKSNKTSLDEQLKQTFQSYEEDGIIDDDNLLRFVTDLEIEPDDVVLLVLCEHMGCETGGEITWSEFERGMKALHCVNIGDVKERLVGLRATLALPEVFDSTYKFAFKLNLQPSKKILDKDTAIALWQLMLDGKFLLLDKWVEFLESRDDVQWISKDVFFQIQTFSRLSTADISSWEDDGAWPCVIDDFVEYMQKAAP